MAHGHGGAAVGCGPRTSQEGSGASLWRGQSGQGWSLGRGSNAGGGVLGLWAARWGEGVSLGPGRVWGKELPSPAGTG